jgi:hypothetical protein
MTEPTTEQLDQVALKQITWKPSVVRNIAIEIVERILIPPFKVWPDEIALENISATDRHVVGIAWRLLAKAEVIQQTGNYRKSTAPGRNSGSVFEYEIKSRSRAETFLKRNNRTAIEHEQGVLTL